MMKCMKVHGAKDRNTVTFLEGKHVENTGGLVLRQEKGLIK